MREFQVFGAPTHIERGDNVKLREGRNADLAGGGHHIKLMGTRTYAHPLRLRRNLKGSRDVEVR
jgi:hypothetical protein